MKARPAWVGALAAIGAGAVIAAGAPAAGAASLSCGNIWGSGASLQGISEIDVWIPNWTPFTCAAKPTIVYTSTSAGTGEAEWGSETGAFNTADEGVAGHFDAFTGSDVAPGGPATTEGTQLFNMDKAGEKSATEPNAVMAVPIEQSAVAQVVSLPVGCTPANPAGAPHLEDSVLEEEWATDKVAFYKLVGGLGLTKANCGEADPTLEVRSNSSGTTAAEKLYLDDLDPTEWGPFVTTPQKSESTEWPTTVSATSSTAGALATKVFETPGTFAFVDDANARAHGLTAKPALHTNAAGEKYYSFITTVQNTGIGGAKTYKGPELANGEANCTTAKYETAPTTVGPNVDWSNAKQTNWSAGGSVYPVCTLAFIDVWHHYGYISEYGKAGAEKHGVEYSVYNYVRWVVDSGTVGGKPAGQKLTLLKEDHYAPLPAAIRLEAFKAVTLANVGF